MYRISSALLLKKIVCFNSIYQGFVDEIIQFSADFASICLVSQVHNTVCLLLGSEVG